MSITTLIPGLLAAYLAGAVPTGYWLGRLARGVDLRRCGSGNIGATNAYRVLGSKLGVAVFCIDVAKGAIPVLAAKFVAFPPSWWVLVGVAAVGGSMFSPFVGFGGGKGVATSLGVSMVFMPGAALISTLVFVVIVCVSRYVSLASVIAAASLPAWAVLLGGEAAIVGAFAVIAAAIGCRHRRNLRALVAGKERKFSWKGGNSGRPCP